MACCPPQDVEDALRLAMNDVPNSLLPEAAKFLNLQRANVTSLYPLRFCLSLSLNPNSEATNKKARHQTKTKSKTHTS